jgi:hypothetical protein
LSPVTVGVSIYASLISSAIFVSLLSGLPFTWRCEDLRVSVGGSFLKIGCGIPGSEQAFFLQHRGFLPRLSRVY